MSRLSKSTAQTRERIRDSLASMTPRDRLLLLGTFFFVFCLGVGFGMYSLRSSLKEMQNSIAQTKNNIQEIQSQGAQLEAIRPEQSALEEKIEKQKSTDLSAFLSKSSQKANIKDRILDRVKEKTSSNLGLLTQKSYSVPLRELSLADFSSFLFEIETAEYPFEIQNCSIRTRKRGEEKKLRVELDIVTYHLNTTSSPESEQ